MRRVAADDAGWGEDGDVGVGDVDAGVVVAVEVAVDDGGAAVPGKGSGRGAVDGAVVVAAEGGGVTGVLVAEGTNGVVVVAGSICWPGHAPTESP